MKAVVQVGIKKDSQKRAIGTGFFLQNEPLIFLTANHVLPNRKTLGKAFLRFNYEDTILNNDDDYVFELNENLLHITGKRRDYSLILIDNPPEIEYTVIGSNFGTPAFSEYDWLSGDPSISIIHHPSEKPKLIATQKDGYCVIQGHPNTFIGYLKGEQELISDLLDNFAKKETFYYWARDNEVNDPFIRCTLPCSSGAPIFDNKWRLIGLHIKGSYTSSTILDFFSIGVPIDRILKDCQRKLQEISFN